MSVGTYPPSLPNLPKNMIKKHFKSFQFASLISWVIRDRRGGLISLPKSVYDRFRFRWRNRKNPKMSPFLFFSFTIKMFKARPKKLKKCSYFDDNIILVSAATSGCFYESKRVWGSHPESLSNHHSSKMVIFCGVRPKTEILGQFRGFLSTKSRVIIKSF